MDHAGSTSVPRYLSRPFIALALIVLYPAGLFLLWRSPRPRRWERIAGTIAFLPVFSALVLLVLKPFWDFGGALDLSRFKLDFGRLNQYERLEAQRAEQAAAPPAATQSEAGAAAPAWTDFRGPRRDGVVRGARLSLDWKTHPPRELYRQPVGEGYASFVVENGLAYTIEQRRHDEAIVCYVLETGRERWKYTYGGRFEEVLGGDGPRATPTLSGDRLYSLGALGDLVCLQSGDGHLVWKQNILTDTDSQNLAWGMSGSPLVADGHIYVTGSGHGGPGVMAYDAETGKAVWKAKAGVQSYSSLMMETLAGVRQLVNLGGDALNGIDPQTGRVLWSFPWRTAYSINVGQPVMMGRDRILIASGYDHGCALIQMEKAGGKLKATQVWANRNLKAKFSSVVRHGRFVFGLDEKILVCLDSETGERKWKDGKYEYGSLLLVNDHLLVMSEDGELALVRAVPDSFEEVGKIRVFHGRTWNNFVVVGDRLLARNHKEMACYDLTPAD